MLKGLQMSTNHWTDEITEAEFEAGDLLDQPFRQVIWKIVPRTTYSLVVIAVFAIGYITGAYVEQDAASASVPITAILSIGFLVSTCLLYTSPSPRDRQKSRMPSSA